MLSEELARYRIEDLVRDADRSRRAREARTAVSGSGSKTRRLLGAVLSVLGWPFPR